jgi:large subunit ribosomal protein L15
MPLELHNLKPKKGSRKGKKRLGRGVASKGAKSGRGTKGQRKRSGGKSGLQLKGLRQMLLRVPKKRGFNSNAGKPSVVQLDEFNNLEMDIVTPAALKKIGRVKETRYGVKIVGRGEIKKKITVKGCLVTASVAKKITEAGGTVLTVKK